MLVIATIHVLTLGIGAVTTTLFNYLPYTASFYLPYTSVMYRTEGLSIFVTNFCILGGFRRHVLQHLGFTKITPMSNDVDCDPERVENLCECGHKHSDNDICVNDVFL